jgi:hypothetical protein
VHILRFWQEEGHIGNDSVNITQIRLKIGENVDEIIKNKFAYLLGTVAVSFDCYSNPQFFEISHSPLPVEGSDPNLDRRLPDTTPFQIQLESSKSNGCGRRNSRISGF